MSNEMFAEEDRKISFSLAGKNQTQASHFLLNFKAFSLVVEADEAFQVMQLAHEGSKRASPRQNLWELLHFCEYPVRKVACFLTAGSKQNPWKADLVVACSCDPSYWYYRKYVTRSLWLLFSSLYLLWCSIEISSKIRSFHHNFVHFSAGLFTELVENIHNAHVFLCSLRTLISSPHFIVSAC